MADYEPIELNAMFRAGHSTIWELADKSGVLASLNMRLARLAALERKKIEDEYLEVIQLIAELEDILANPARVLSIIKDELLDVKKRYAGERRTRSDQQTGRAGDGQAQQHPSLHTGQYPWCSAIWPGRGMPSAAFAKAQTHRSGMGVLV